MRIGFVELVLLLFIASITVGPNVALFVDRWLRRAQRTSAAAARRKAQLEAQAAIEREALMTRFRVASNIFALLMLAALAYGLLLRPIDTPPKAYTAPDVRQDTGAAQTALSADSKDGWKLGGYLGVDCVRTQDGLVYAAAYNGAAMKKRQSDLVRTDGGHYAAILSVEGELTSFAFDADGDPRLYMNTIIGLASRDYDFTRFQPMLHTFEQQPQGGVYADVFWMGLENALYEKEAPRRPVLTALRQEYARALLAESGEGGPPLSPEAVRRGWAQRVLGLPQDGDASLRALLDGLAFSPDWDEQAVTRRTEELLYQYFHRARRSVTDRQWAAFAGRSLTKGGGIRFVKPNALRALSHTEGGGTGGVQAPRILSFLQGRTPEPILRRYVEDCFGVSMLTPSELAEAERLLCTGPHRNCRLHFTRGTPPDRPPSPAAAWDAEHFRQQRAKNRAYYQAHLAQNQMTLHQLTQKLQNVLLLRQDEDGAAARSGRLRPELTWRAAALDDEQVLLRRQPDQPDELSVDILLDASASQNLQQEKLATQAYLIAESLTRCHIPVRVSFFCSVSGCTVLRILRDFGHPEENDACFDYTAAGWNRDGLALRAMGWLMRRSTVENRLLLLLSDASPNDDQRIPMGALPLGGYSYSGKRGVEDTAGEAAVLRRQGIRPVCIFTGSDQELDSARRIYGAAVERIPTAGWLADAVSRLLCAQLTRT